MWPALPKPTTYAHYGKEQFSLSMDRSINKLTIIISTPLPNVDGASFVESCFWGLSYIHKCPGCSLNATSWLVQAATLLEITTRLVNVIGHGFTYISWQFECNGTFLWAVSHYKLVGSAVICHFVAPHHPPPSTPIQVLVMFIQTIYNAVSCALWSR